jgi:hydroxyacylglutathione hydrolase
MQAHIPHLHISATLTVLTVPAFSDNYLWIIHNGSKAIVIDPGDAGPILTALQQHNLELIGILLTHHHADHIGGVDSLLKQFSVPVYGPHNDGIACVSHALHDLDVLHIPELDITLTVLAVAGHTLGHIAYYAKNEAILFCGDTLFGAGCGRLFEGTPLQMHTSLMRLANLPQSTQVFCAHEYTLSNLRFAHAIEPNNQAIIARIANDTKQRDLGLPTIPTIIGVEISTNPFLRCDEVEVIETLIKNKKITAASNAVEHFAALRLWKNTYA